MQSQSLISLWRQRFTCGSCALALVGSLALYHKTVLTNPIVDAQSRLDGNTAINPKGIRMQPGLAGIAFERLSRSTESRRVRRATQAGDNCWRQQNLTVLRSAIAAKGG